MRSEAPPAATTCGSECVDQRFGWKSLVLCLHAAKTQSRREIVAIGDSGVLGPSIESTSVSGCRARHADHLSFEEDDAGEDWEQVEDERESDEARGRRHGRGRNRRHARREGRGHGSDWVANALRDALGGALKGSGRDAMLNAFEQALRGGSRDRSGEGRQRDQGRRRGRDRGRQGNSAAAVWRDDNVVRFSHLEEPGGEDYEICGNDIVASHARALSFERGRFADNQVRGAHISELELSDSGFRLSNKRCIHHTDPNREGVHRRYPFQRRRTQ